jgi:hypothetical protein
MCWLLVCRFVDKQRINTNRRIIKTGLSTNADNTTIAHHCNSLFEEKEEVEVEEEEEGGGGGGGEEEEEEEKEKK